MADRRNHPTAPEQSGAVFFRFIMAIDQSVRTRVLEHLQRAEFELRAVGHFHDLAGSAAMGDVQAALGSIRQAVAVVKTTEVVAADPPPMMTLGQPVWRGMRMRS